MSVLQDHLDNLSFDAVIPSALLLNENVEPNCIKFYAFVRGLTRAHGYCYATNKYLAALMKSDESSVRRWLHSLSEEGFISIETEKNGIHWQRRIFISNDFKKCLRRGKNEHPPAQKSAPPRSKISTIIKNSKKKIVEEVNSSPNTSKEPPSAKASELSEYLFSKIKERNPEAKQPNLDKWAAEMDRMIKIDKRDPEKIKAIIDWVHQDLFWQANCLCVSTLRKHYDKILMKVKVSEMAQNVQLNKDFVSYLRGCDDKFSNLKYDDNYAMIYGTSKEIPLNQSHEMFKKTLASIYGVQYES